MERFNWKYLLYGVAAVFLVLIVIELSSKKKEPEVETASEAVMQSTQTEPPSAEPQPEETVRLTPSKTQVSGPLHGYYEVVDRNYKVSGGKIHVELRRLKEGFPTPWNEEMELGYSEECFEPGFYVEFLDTDGDIVGKDETSIIYDKQELRSLADLNLDETATLTFSTGSPASVSFRLGSMFLVHEPDPVEEKEDEKAYTSQTPSSATSSESRRQAATSASSSDYDESVYDDDDDEQYDDESYDDESNYDDDDESTWQKVKKKSKRMYRNARQKFRNWLDK